MTCARATLNAASTRFRRILLGDVFLRSIIASRKKTRRPAEDVVNAER